MKTATKRNPLDSLQAGSDWVDSLMNLFWECDDAVKNGAELPPLVQVAYDRAEAARQALA